MKKLLLILLVSVLALPSFAQISDGYYRVESVYYSRYMALLDNTGYARSSRNGIDYDLYSVRTLLDNDINKIASNPATIVRITPLNSTDYSVSAQGVDVRDRLLNTEKNAHFYITRAADNSNAYRFSAEAANIARVVLSDNSMNVNDENLPDSGRVLTSGSNGRNWLITPVQSGTANYFGFSPTLRVNGKYYQTFYAAFPFRIVSSGVKVYYVSNLFWKGDAVIREFNEGDIIPASTPVLVECSSVNSSENQIQPVLEGGTAVASNYLRGVYFNYYFNRYNRPHNNRTAFNPSTMRVLRVRNDSLVFVNNPSEAANGTYYLPANEAYLQVPAGSPAEMPVMSYSEYLTGIKSIKTDNPDKNKEVYTINGVKVTDSNNLPHGIYLQEGKKIIK